ncbi:hypothetical protein QBC36DRAFT_292554 [Triangularia setosa]|uniref:Uncharacterized protein n=1 Tax=Triangularia setosa TaxID=2587417 RepID=A0AAN6W3L9_9PEZI|nr:hypothetical protein QBC36DRAFT_292554 [Podospora setosa]
MKFIDTTALALALMGLAPTAVLAVCADGEVGIGRQMSYTGTGTYGGNHLTADNWVMVSNNCDTFAVSDKGFHNDPCSAGPRYNKNGYYVKNCDGSGKPGLVETSGGNFGNCYNNPGRGCATGPFFFKGVQWCCKRLTWA